MKLDKTKKMNILLLTQFLSTTKGGGEYVFSVLAKALAEKGHKIWIVTNRIDGETYWSHDNIKFVFVPPVIHYSGGMPPSFSDNIQYVLHAVKKGLDIIKKEKIDIIHSNNFAPAISGSILSLFTGKPHVTTIHDVFSLCGKNYWKLWGRQNNVSRLNVLLAPLFEKLIMKLRHSCIHTVSEASKEDLLKFGAKKPIYVIPNTLETTTLRKIETKRFQFVYVGRLVFYKNLEVVIRAIKKLENTFPDVNLVIAGGGPHKEDLRKLVMQLQLEDKIKFEGYVSAEKKLELIAESQALVFPSLCEGFGLVILEAFSQQKPVLVSNIRPLSDIVSDNVNGILIPPFDEQKWADAMKKIIADQKKSGDMGYAGWNTLHEKYTNENMSRDVLCMYKDMIIT